MYNYNEFFVNNRVLNNEINLLKKEHIKNTWQKNWKKKKMFQTFFFLLTFDWEWMKNSAHLEHILIIFLQNL